MSKYDAGGDIEELLGLIRVKPKTQEKFKKESNVIHAVKDSKKPKNDPLNYDGTAFHEAGEIVCLAPSTVYDIYKKRRDISLGGVFSSESHPITHAVSMFSIHVAY